MKSKILLKRTLPIIIALFVIVVVALVATVVTLDKKTPGFSKGVGEEAYLTYTNDGVSISMTKNDVYQLLRDENYGASSTVNQLVRMIDEDLLTNGTKNYLSLAGQEDVVERVEYAVLGYTLEDFIKAKKDGYELSAKKENKTYEAYLQEQIEDAIDKFKSDFLTAYGIKLNDNDITYSANTINVNNTSAVYKYYQLEEAKYLYAREVIETEYKEDLVEYNEYVKNKETYDKYTAALERYESDLAKWKDADKKTRGSKPVKADYIKNYDVKEEPEEVSAPALVESNFSSKYAKEYVDKYWAVVLTYSNQNLAKDALSQNGAKIVGGKWLSTTTDSELSDAEVVDVVIGLYNQYYQNLGKDELTTAAFTPDWTDEESEFYYSASSLSSLGIYAKNTTNNVYNYESGYAYNDKLSSTIYLVVSRDKQNTWDEYLEAQDKKYYETDFYNSVLSELLDDATSSVYIDKAMAKLRCESDLLIYDTQLESVYMNSYESDYKATKKASKLNVVSYKVNGQKHEISVDDLFASLAGTQYGVSSFIYKYQYNWMFLEAKDADGQLFNQYVDYQAYLNGTSFKKASKNEEMYNDAKEYLDNVKANFKANAYADSEGNGYNKKYGFNNFIRDYYNENYNVDLNSEDDLMVFYVYQQLMNEYQAYQTKITLAKWNDVYKIYMAKAASEYMSLTAEELIISLTDAKGNKVDPINWTAEQLASAKELYDEVLAAIPSQTESNISTFLSALETAFDNAPKAINGAYTGDYAYVFNYAQSFGKTVTINVSKYKSLGFDVTSTTGSFTNSSADEFLKYAARDMWKSWLPELIKGKAVSEVLIYDTTWTPKDYYGIGNGHYVANASGLVVLVATSANYSSYFKTVGSSSSASAAKDRIHALMKAYEELHNQDAGYESFEALFAEWKNADNAEEVETKIFNVFKNELGLADISSFDDVEVFFTSYIDDRQTFIGFPSLAHVLMYLYDQSKTNEDDYVSFADLYDDYEDAVKDSADLTEIKEKIMNKVNKYVNDSALNVNFATFDDFLPVLTKYADSDTSAYVKSQITNWFTTYSTSSSTLVYGNYASTSYANKEMFTTLLNNLNANFSGDEIVKNIMEELVNTSIENADNSLSYLKFTKNDKDAVKELLNAVYAFKGIDVASADLLDVLFTYGDDYSAEKTTYTEIMQSLSTYTLNAYNSLSASDKEELHDLAVNAGLVD